MNLIAFPHVRIITVHGVLLFEIPLLCSVPFPFYSQLHLHRVSCTVSRESIFFLGCGTLFEVSFTFNITNIRLFGIPIDFFCLTDHGWVAVAKSLPRSQGKLLHFSPYKMSKNWAFIAGTEYRRRIPDIFVQLSAYYEALLRHEVTCCFYCNKFHPTAFLPSDFSAATVNLLFSLMDRPFCMLTPCLQSLFVSSSSDSCCQWLSPLCYFTSYLGMLSKWIFSLVILSFLFCLWLSYSLATVPFR